MCGFLVMVNRSDARDFPAALETLAPRGPDAEGIWCEGPVQMGHRRLSVIDLVGGIQPMASGDGRYHLVYNGEIYNFQEIRQRLEVEGHRFQTRSDTEVLLEAWVRWGPACLPDFDGIFAFAIWDAHERSLLLARDRLGVKPLFYSSGSSGQRDFACASTLSPFWKLSGQDRTVNYSALCDYLAQHFFSGPGTILSSVRELEPGTWLRWQADSGQTEIRRYWDLPAVTDQPMELPDLVEAADAALRGSIRRQLVSDVDLGVFFSGGIDSSLVAYYMREITGKPPRTFTVKFDHSPRHDEAPIAARVAAALGTNHCEYRAGQIDQSVFAQTVADMDQPFGDSSYIPVLQMSQLARREVKVVLGGDGGDELFGGYPRYLKDASHYPDGAWHRAIRRMVEAGLLPAALYRSALRGDQRVVYHFSRMHPYPATGRSVRSILSAEGAQRCHPDEALNQWMESVTRSTGAIDADSLMRADVWYYLAQNCLVKTDRATMAFGLEARVPFLGNEVVDLVLPQPGSTKLAHGLKTVLMELAKRYLPRDCWDRPKRGFTVPENDYLTRAWLPYCDHLIDQCARLAPFLDATEVARRWQATKAGRRTDCPLYGIVILLGWLETHSLKF